MSENLPTVDLQEQLDSWLARSKTLGVAVAVRIDGELLWSGSSGVADPQGSQPVAPDGRYLIYSITKTFTAVCVLKLAQAGLLDVEEPVARWLAELDLPEAITIRHLLQHTSGLRDYGALPQYHADVKTHPSAPWGRQQFLDATLSQGLLFAPGAGWAYSNIGYMLLRDILETATGKSFRQCVDEQIARPLGLTRTVVAESQEDLGDLVSGYGREVSPDGELLDVRSVYHPGWCAPGVVTSTASEITRFYDRLFAGDLLDPVYLSMMLQTVRVPGEHPPAVSPSYGLGLLADPDGPFGPYYGHGGGGPGYSLWASILPHFHAGRLCIATFCNSSEGPGAEGADRELLTCIAATP